MKYKDFDEFIEDMENHSPENRIQIINLLEVNHVITCMGNNEEIVHYNFGEEDNDEPFYFNHHTGEFCSEEDYMEEEGCIEEIEEENVE